MPTLEDGINHLYDVAVTKKLPRSNDRLRVFAEYAIEQLAARGLEGAEKERIIEGWVRRKKWDVMHRGGGRVRLGISLKSMLRNFSGSVPNRSDELIGEAADVQMRYPEIIVGYIMLMDVTGKGAEKWIPEYEQRIARMAGRAPPFWVLGTVEAAQIVRVDFSPSPPGGTRLVSPPNVLDGFFDTLASQYLLRNPPGGAPAPKAPDMDEESDEAEVLEEESTGRRQRRGRARR